MWQFHWLTHSKHHCNYSTHTVFSVFTSRCLVEASNRGHSLSSGFLNCLQSQLPASHFSWLKVKVKVTLRLAVYRQSVCLGVKPLETHNQTFFFQLNYCVNRPYVTSSLTRRWVYLLWIFLAFRQTSHNWATSPCYIVLAWTAQKISLPLLCILTLLGKEPVHRVVP
jgi:hypothetical protein